MNQPLTQLQAKPGTDQFPTLAFSTDCTERTALRRSLEVRLRKEGPVLFSSQLAAIVGIDTGDEGKGRTIIDAARLLRIISGDEDVVGMVFKVNGGANSGHTACGLKLNLLPAGVGDRSIPWLGVGRGVVADPRKFIWEAVPLERQGIRVFPRLIIDQRAMVSDLTHRLEDLAGEIHLAEKTGTPRGSTGRGITPAYCDETGQSQIHYSAFLGSREEFARQMRDRAEQMSRTIRDVYQLGDPDWWNLFDRLGQAERRANAASINSGVFDAREFDFRCFRSRRPFELNVEKLIDVYWDAGRALRSHIGDVGELILQLQAQGRYVLGEFGQAYWLDKRHGYRPNVTASHTYTPEFFQSANIPVQPVHTIGVCKAYDTKVGTHIFLTKMDDDHPLTPCLKVLEFGTSTGRQRMVGWFDAVAKGHTLRRGGFQDLVINKLDALSYQGNWHGDLQICTAYQDSSGTLLRTMPDSDEQRRNLKPVFESYRGWAEDISGVRRFRDLPVNAQLYVAGMYRAIVKAAYQDGALPEKLPCLRFIGVGPDPDQIISDAPAPEVLMAM